MISGDYCEECGASPVGEHHYCERCFQTVVEDVGRHVDRADALETECRELRAQMAQGVSDEELQDALAQIQLMVGDRQAVEVQLAEAKALLRELTPGRPPYRLRLNAPNNWLQRRRALLGEE